MRCVITNPPVDKTHVVPGSLHMGALQRRLLQNPWLLSRPSQADALSKPAVAEGGTILANSGCRAASRGAAGSRQSCSQEGQEAQAEAEQAAGS